MKRLKLTLICAIAVLACTAQDSLYHEPYRPQYHYTPAHRCIGDPSGLLRHDGRYMAYSWGAAESSDLVHWREINKHSIGGVPEDISTFTGSVVVDTANTSGYGKNAYIAAFTSFDKNSKKQSQSIAFSRDRGETYRYYDQNPVLDLWSTEFRDPTVIPFPKDSVWLMAVAKALEKKVALYTSPDLKHWTWTSDFGPMGDAEKSWECPDLFQLPLDGNPNDMRWVLLVSVNWAREQYFVGDFNGKKFVPDSTFNFAKPVYVDDGLDYYASRVFQDYDHATGSAPVYTLGWLNTWDYANHAPTTYGKGMWSIPRQYTLVSTTSGPRLRQKPVAALKSLRGKKIEHFYRLKSGVIPLKGMADMHNVYELNADFDIKDDKPFGLWLCEGDGRRVSLTYDPASGFLNLDRTNVSDTKIPVFDRMSHVKVVAPAGKLQLQIFVDKSSIEIFVNDGEYTLSALTFPGQEQTGASLFSLGSSTTCKITAWPMQSIHE